MQFRVLGPLEVDVSGDKVRVPAGQMRVLLASLLCRANEVVSLDELCEHLWTTTGANSPNTVRSYVRRLRDVLSTADPSREFIQHRPPGYLLAAEPDEVDLLRFRTLTDSAAHAADASTAARLLDEALRLWRGTALADVKSDALHRDVVPVLLEERLHALESWMDAELSLGNHAGLIAELTRHTTQHPLRERFWAQLMLALYRSGRQADALESYQTLQRTLADELGIDPSDEVRQLHQAILTNDDSLLAGQPTTTPTQAQTDDEPARPTPHQLPADTRGFVGRDVVLSRIGEYLRPGDSGGLGLVVISGQPGAGKTALAVHAGHRLRAEFPDGQLFADLRGHADAPVASSDDVLGRFLRALGVPPQQIPADADEQAALYRSVLTDRRVLVVLDNAASAQQVRTLLPGSPGCAVLVTSRNNLHGLVAADGAKAIRLDELAPADSVTLLRHMLDDLISEPDAAQLAEECAHLPLALRLAGAQLLDRGDVSGYLGELRQGNRLEALTVADDDQITVRTAFDLSYAALKPEARRLFRLLGLIPGPCFDASTAAALHGGSGVQPVLDQLTTANLVLHHEPGRYKLHDLLRVYAAQRAFQDESEVDAARARLFGYYLHSAERADRLLRGNVDSVPFPELPPGVHPSTVDDYQHALSWCEAERANLVAAVHEAHRLDYPEHAHTLAFILQRFFALTWHSRDLIDTHRIGVESARRQGNRGMETLLMGRLGATYTDLAQFDNALDLLHQALGLADKTGDPRLKAVMLNHLGIALWRLGRVEEAADHYERALHAHRLANNPHGEAGVLANLGRVRTHTGKYAEAIDFCSQAVALTREFGDPNHQGIAWLNLGEAYDGNGQAERAAEAYRTAITVARECRDRHTEALSLFWLGKNLERGGDSERARESFDRSVEIFTELGEPRVEDVRLWIAEFAAGS